MKYEGILGWLEKYSSVYQTFANDFEPDEEKESDKDQKLHEALLAKNKQD